MGRKIDLTGREFGFLKVIKDSGERKWGMVIWECECRCGNIYNVLSRYLTNGEVRSCGCLRYPDIIGETFNRLTILEKTDRQSGGGNYLCKCRCECGNTTYALAHHITTGYKKSCGCYAKEESSKRGHKQIKRAQEGTQEYLAKGTNAAQLDSNSRPQKNNTSGHVGVSWDSSKDRWRAYITFCGTHYRLGDFEDKTLAAKARKEAERRLHGEFLDWYRAAHPKQWEKIQNKKTID